MEEKKEQEQNTNNQKEQIPPIPGEEEVEAKEVKIQIDTQNNQELQELSQNEQQNQDEKNNKLEDKNSNLDTNLATVTPPLAKASKDDIKEKLEYLKQKTSSVYKEYEDKVNELKGALFNLAKLEDNILKNRVNSLMDSFKKLQIPTDDFFASIKEIEYDNKEQEMQIKEPPSGKVKGMFLGILTFLIALVALTAYGAKLAQIKLNFASLMVKSNLDAIASVYLKMLNINQSPTIGYVIIGLVSLILGFLVYKLVTILQKIKNKKYIQELEKNSMEFEKNLRNKIINIQELLEHIKKIKSVTKKYDVILNEQDAKIKRALFIEKPQSLEDLHYKSKVEVEKTLLIVDELLSLMNTPVNEEETINQASINALKNANAVINEVIRKIYE
jgi:hypothetical protein